MFLAKLKKLETVNNEFESERRIPFLMLKDLREKYFK